MAHSLNDLDAGQLDLMWSFLQLRPKNSCTKQDVVLLKTYLDKIRQALVQKTAGQRHGDSKCYTDFADLGTYVNLAVLQALTLYIYGGLDVLENQLEDVQESE